MDDRVAVKLAKSNRCMVSQSESGDLIRGVTLRQSVASILIGGFKDDVWHGGQFKSRYVRNAVIQRTNHPAHSFAVAPPQKVTFAVVERRKQLDLGCHLWVSERLGEVKCLQKPLTTFAVVDPIADREYGACVVVRESNPATNEPPSFEDASF